MNNKITYIDIDNKTYKEIILDKNSINGFKIIGNNAYKLSLYDMSLLWEILFPKKAMNKISKYLDYDVYYDEENKLKHFIKNGEEDYYLFLKQNGVLAHRFLPDDKDFKKKQNSKELKQKYKIAFKKGIIIADAIGILLCLNMLGRYYYPYFESKISNIDNYIVEEYFSRVTDVNQAKEYIYSSDGLTEDQKKLLFNEDLFRMVMPYYKGTPMESLIAERLNGINVEYYIQANRPEIAGYYAGDNVIHIKDGCEKITIGHEMAHLLQNPLCQRHFFIESMADLIQKEFYFESYEGYPLEDENLRLLINTIGPEPIWEYVFSGNFNKINEILLNNLNDNDYARIMEILNSDEIDSEMHKDLQYLICILYKNIYHQDIKDNKDIFDMAGRLIDQIYFNDDIMPKENSSLIADFSIPDKYFVYKNVPIISITKDEAIKLRKEGYIVKSSLIPTSGATNPTMSGSDAKTRENMISFTYNNKPMFMKETEAIENGYFTRKYELVYEEKAKANLSYEVPDDSEMISYPTLDNYNYTMEIIDSTRYYNIYSNNIHDRFPNQEIAKSKNHNHIGYIKE